jgi:hypothetical protein
MSDGRSGAWFLEGLAQAAVAILLVRLSKSELILQPSLALWTTGTALASIGAASSASADGKLQSWVGAFTLMALSFFYPQFLGRLVALLGVGWWILFGLLDLWREPASADPTVIGLALAGGLIWLNQESIWRKGRFWGEMVRPYGLATFVLLFEVFMMSQWKICGSEIGWASSAIVVTLVLWLTARICHKLQLSLADGAWGLGSVLIVGAVTSSAPAIMAGLGIMLVGFYVREKLLGLLGGCYLIYFVTAWYDKLELVDTSKASLLLILGAVLLGLRRFLVSAK